MQTVTQNFPEKTLFCVQRSISLEAAIGTSRGSFQILRLSAFILAQEVQDYVKASPRKLPLKLAALTQNFQAVFLGQPVHTFVSTDITQEGGETTHRYSDER